MIFGIFLAWPSWSARFFWLDQVGLAGFLAFYGVCLSLLFVLPKLVCHFVCLGWFSLYFLVSWPILIVEFVCPDQVRLPFFMFLVMLVCHLVCRYLTITKRIVRRPSRIIPIYARTSYTNRPKLCLESSHTNLSCTIDPFSYAAIAVWHWHPIAARLKKDILQSSFSTHHC